MLYDMLRHLTTDPTDVSSSLATYIHIRYVLLVIVESSFVAVINIFKSQQQIVYTEHCSYLNSYL